MSKLFDNTTQAKLQQHYLAWINDYLTLSKFAEDHNLSISDAEDLINMGRAAHEGIVRRRNDERYDVAYVSLGDPRMHNYQAFFNSKLIGYALSEDEGWGICEAHHIDRMADLESA